MKNKQLGIVSAVAIFLLAGCGQSIPEKENDPNIADKTNIQNENEVQPDILNEKIIEIIDGSPAEKTENYSQKAIEAQNRLELLLEQNSRASFLDKIIPPAFAEDSDNDDEVENLLAEIQTYLELAAEAATESTDPEEIAELLSTVQTTQNATIDLFAEIDSSAEVENLVDEIAESGDEISAAADEAASAIELGLSEIEIDIETDVEDFIASGTKKINLREKRDPIRRATRKIQSAQNEYQKTKTKLIRNGVDEISAEEMLVELREQIATAETKMGEGEFAAAGESATAGKKSAKRIKNASEATHRVREFRENLQTAAEAGDAIAIEKLEKLQPLVEEQKELKTLIEERVELRREFVEEAKSARTEIQKVRRGDRAEFRELKQKQISGEITEEEFAAQKEEFVESAKLQKEEAREVRGEMKTERENAREEVQQKIETQKEEVKNVREQIRDEAEEARENLPEEAREKTQIQKKEIKNAHEQLHESAPKIPENKIREPINSRKPEIEIVDPNYGMKVEFDLGPTESKIETQKKEVKNIHPAPTSSSRSHR